MFYIFRAIVLLHKTVYMVDSCLDRRPISGPFVASWPSPARKFGQQISAVWIQSEPGRCVSKRNRLFCFIHTGWCHITTLFKFYCQRTSEKKNSNFLSLEEGGLWKIVELLSPIRYSYSMPLLFYFGLVCIVLLSKRPCLSILFSDFVVPVG